MIFDDAVGDGEAEAGALRTFGGEKRFEDAVLKLRRDAFARVAHRDDQPPVVSRLAQLDAPALWHRVERVKYDVYEDFAHFRGVGFDEIAAFNFALETTS